MELKNPFEKIVQLRKRIGGSELSLSFGGERDPIQEIKIRLKEEGIEVERGDIETSFGPFLTYQGEALAILYIYDTNYSYEDLIQESVDKRAPKFHFSWCRTLQDMEDRGRFQRYILSRRDVNKFKVQAKEVEPHLIEKFGEHHEMEDVSLFACKNCLSKTAYRGYDKKDSALKKRKSVEEFDIKEFLNEHEGTFTTWKFYQAHATDKTVSLNVYNDSFPELSRTLRAEAAWICSKCGVDMKRKKDGLHVHHRNGVKNDDSISNLQILCALCHKNIDESHKRMFVSSDIEQFINRNRNAS